MGMGVASTKTFRNVRRQLSDICLSACNIVGSSSTSTHLHHKVVTCFETQLQGALNALKTYMITKERRISAEFVGIFASQLEVHKKCNTLINSYYA